MVAKSLDFNGTFEAFSKNSVRKNMWRFKHLPYDHEDLYQDCAVKFYQCKNKYEETIENDRNFMALFKRAINNHFIDLSNFDTCEKARQDIEWFDDDGNEIEKDFIGAPESSNFQYKVESAPEYIKAFITLAINTDLMVHKNNVKVCKMLGLDHKQINIFKEVKEYFKGE